LGVAIISVREIVKRKGLKVWKGGAIIPRFLLN